ncbi:MAG: thioredoxin family protein [Candidatus Marinimicrobia bacterium]|nr:thioredoxin family protein [Candidatus Neomarinimicrobiota bacterium]
MQVELFVAGCRLCNEAQLKYSRRFSQWEIEIHRADECTDGSCCQKAAQYGLTAVPALVIDGKLVQVGNPTEQDLLRLERMF